jgi:hypothetical protein
MVSHCGITIYIKKYLNAKEELWEVKYFTMKKYNLQKHLPKETKILQDIITLQLISSFNTSQKSAHIKIDLLPKGKIPLSYYFL